MVYPPCIDHGQTLVLVENEQLAKVLAPGSFPNQVRKIAMKGLSCVEEDQITPKTRLCC